LVTQSLNPQEYPWKSLHKALLVLKSLICYGSELAVDKIISLTPNIEQLSDYNSVTTPKSYLFPVAGMDYGAPVRELAKELSNILKDDNEIRKTRNAARGNGELFIPKGNVTQDVKQTTNNQPGTFYGQGVTSSVGASHGLEAVPGMYSGRPDRYYDKDAKKNIITGDHQTTREVKLSHYHNIFV
jgi:hypothetical protein